MPDDRKQRKRHPLVCPICGTPLVKTPEGNYVCPICGIVYGPVMIPGYQQFSHSAPANSIIIKLPKFNVAKILEAVGDYVSEEEKEVMKELLYDIASRNYVLEADASVVRELAESVEEESMFDRVRRIERVKEAMFLYGDKYSIPQEVVEEAFYKSLLYRRYWSGKSAERVACMFLAVTCEETGKCNYKKIAGNCKDDYNKIKEVISLLGGESNE